MATAERSTPRCAGLRGCWTPPTNGGRSGKVGPDPTLPLTNRLQLALHPSSNSRTCLHLYWLDLFAWPSLQGSCIASKLSGSIIPKGEDRHTCLCFPECLQPVQLLCMSFKLLASNFLSWISNGARELRNPAPAGTVSTDCTACSILFLFPIVLTLVPSSGGDWRCERTIGGGNQCGWVNFASSSKCYHCTAPRHVHRLDRLWEPGASISDQVLGRGALTCHFSCCLPLQG